ncbi:MAG: hypothetical protein U1E10_01620 [Bdellovibrionales bacterium]|nr:hypothetical protein [Bdellovibrionales bacterium]
MKIHIFGASGSGTTTLGAALAETLGAAHFDSDNYYWKKTDPPFVEKNSISERQRLMLSDMKEHDSWVLSGSMDSWSEPFVPLFDLAVFMRISTEVRMARIKLREAMRHGDRILPGGDMHQAHLDFLAWAEQYDQGVLTGRSLRRHEEWMSGLTCQLLRLEDERSVADSVKIVLKRLNIARY